MPSRAGIVASAKAGAWSPLNLPGLQVWLDPSDSATVTLVATKVSQLNDKSGNAKHVTQGTDSRRPTITTLNGLNALSFAGAQALGHSSLTAVPLGTAQTVLMVATKSTGAGGAYTITMTDGAAQANHMTIASNYAPGAFEVYAQNVFSVQFTIVVSSTGHHVVGLRRDGTAITGRYDAAASGSGTASANNAVYAWALGAQGPDALAPMTGTIGEVIITNTALSAGDLASAESYLKSRWGTP